MRDSGGGRYRAAERNGTRDQSRDAPYLFFHANPSAPLSCASRRRKRHGTTYTRHGAGMPAAMRMVLAPSCKIAVALSTAEVCFLFAGCAES
eukprot:8073523-Pyramimonas_sp.AAC.1